MKQAFTMAEILLSLTIIGVVAAITLPSLTGNINERTWNTQRKALYSRMSQAISLMPAVNGFGIVKEESSSDAGDAVDTATETFITGGLSKVLQINNICDNNHLQDCGIPAQITTVDATKINFPTTMGDLNSKMVGELSTATHSIYITNTKAAAFETKNGESIAAYTNPYCIGSLQDIHWGGSTGTLFQRTVCANFIFDLNGKKGPNTVGKDIGIMTIMYPTDPIIVMPQPTLNIFEAGTYPNAAKLCTNAAPEYRIPNMEETYSMFVNKKLVQPRNFSGSNFWSSTVVKRPVSPFNNVVITANMTTGEIDDWSMGNNFQTWCVKR